MSFDPGCSPPFYAWDTPKEDQRSRKRKLPTLQVTRSYDGWTEEEEGILQKGYIGKPKSMRPILLERR